MSGAPGQFGGAGLDTETLAMMLDALDEYVGHELSEQRQLELDHEDVCPEDLVRAMSDPEQLGHRAGLRVAQSGLGHAGQL